MTRASFLRPVLLAGVCLLLSNSGSAQSSRIATPFGADLVESFELIALRNEYGATGWTPVRKWQKPVRVFIDSRAGYLHIQEKLVAAHLANLALITDHDIRITTDKQKANTLLVFDREINLRALADSLAPDEHLSDEFLNSAVCFATFYLQSDSSIRKAVIVIPVDRARAKAKLPSCIVEELTQILGLINDSDKVFPSIFNDNSIDEELSPHDIRLLELLYHPRVKAGMSRDQVIPIIRELSQLIP